MAKTPTSVTRAKSLRQTSGGTERAVWKLLRDRRLSDVKFRRQHPIAPYIADFACVSAMLVIEIDDPSHTIDEQRAYDERRTTYLSNLGWRVMRVRDVDADADPSGFVARVVDALRS